VSQENVDRLLRVVDDINATGRLGAGFDSLVDPQIRFKDEIGAYDNREELRSFLKGFAEAIGGLHVEVLEVRDLGNTLLLRVIQSGRGDSSDAPVEQPFTWVMAFEGSRCVRWRIYADHAAALEAVGLGE
jgi:ketosteroid isomerase-like protein